MKAVVFDLGGTLMEYVGMPHSWIPYYKKCFENVRSEYSLKISDDDIVKSVQILSDFNPRFKPREVEYSPDYLFEKATSFWDVSISIKQIINSFFKEMNLTAKIYDDTLPCLKILKEKGYSIAVLTDLPSSMPNEMFIKDIPQITGSIDLYMSSAMCGFRKPNKQGVCLIAEKLNIEITDLCFVGDELKDIQTAKNAGCKAVCINRNNEYKDYGQDYTISVLEELLDNLY